MIQKLLTAVFFSATFLFVQHAVVYYVIVKQVFHTGYAAFPSLFFIMSCVCLAGLALMRFFPHTLRRYSEIVIFTWTGCLAILFGVCLLSLPLQAFFMALSWPLVDLEKGLLFFSFVTIIYAFSRGLKAPSVIFCSIPVPSSVPTQAGSIRAVVLSDIHVSGLVTRRLTAALVQQVNDLNPDFIFLTGDLMDGYLSQLHAEIAPLKGLRAKRRICYVTGNHEYYSQPTVWKEHFEQEFGWCVLANMSETCVVDGMTINILGVEDRHWLSFENKGKREDNRFDLAAEHLHAARLLQENPTPLENCLNILLCHQPRDVSFLKDLPWVHAQVSGHTHGGQIWPLFIFVKKQQKYVSGLYRVGHQHLYINQGTGFWGPPMRLGTRSEVTVLAFHQSYVG